MKISTLLLFCYCFAFSTTLLAKPISPPNSTLRKTSTELKYVPDPGSTLADSSLSKPKKSFPPFFFIDNDSCGMNNGGVNITPDPNTPGPWTYFWNTGATTQDLTGVPPGEYFVAITDANGDVQSMSFEITDVTSVTPLMLVGGAVGNSTCIPPFNGSVTLNVQNVPGFPAATYEWSTGATTQNISVLEDGPYTVTVTIGATCETELTVIVPDLANSPSFGTQIADAHCEMSDGGARLLGVQGVPPLTYIWSNGNTNSFMLGLPGGDYDVTVTGGNGCTSTVTLTVPNINWDIEVLTHTEVNASNCNNGNGSIDLMDIEPNLLGYTYEWSTGATTQDISNLDPGLYTVTITLTPACTVQRVYDIDLVPVVPELNLIGTNSKCGLSNGQVSLTTLPGGAPPYTYLWSNAATTQNLTNVPAGPYQVTVTGTNGCTVVGDVSIDDDETPFSYIGTVTDQTSCDTNSNGKIVLSLIPATLTYQWSNGANSTILSNLPAGDYTVTISAGGTCTAVETYNVSNVVNYPVIPIVPNASTCGLANGSVDLTVNGMATGPYTYLWSNGATTEDLSLIKADTFFVTVTSSEGCSTSNQVIVTNNNNPFAIADTVVNNLSCTSPTGMIDLNITPVDTSYTFLWSSGETTDSLFNLNAGTYLVTVTLGLSCVVRDTFEVLNLALPPALSTSSNAANCDLNTGSANLSVTNGVAPYTYSWSNAATTEDLSNLAPGAYTVTVTGANGCTALSNTTILNNNTPLSVNGTPVGNTTCAAGNGSIDIGVSPAGSYNYLWSNAATTEDLNNLPVGDYTVTVSLGTCLSTNTFSIVNNAFSPNLSSSGAAATCGLSDGAADLNVSGGTGPFTYLWSNAATSEDLVNLAPNTYTVTVTGANNCTSTSLVVVQNNNIALNVNAAPVGNSSCTAANGALDISVAPSGAYTYLWSNASTDEDLSNLTDGTYTVTITLGTCQSTNIFLVADNTASPTVSANIVAAICSLNNGSIDLNVTGVPGPFDYEWSNASTDEDLNSILPGTYTVTVTAANGCTEVTNLNVPNNASTFSLAATAAALTDCASNNGAIDLNVTPAGAFTYLWSNSETTEDLNNLAPGTYTVSVTQSGSCTATASYFVIDQRTNPLSSQAIVPELCGLSDGSIDLNVIGGTTPYTYQWIGGQTTQDLNNLSAGVYDVTVTDANNCTVATSASVPGNSISFALSGIPSANSSCLQNNGAIDLSINPPGGVNYTWSNQAITEDLSGLDAGTYTVTVSAGGNCTNTAEFTITSNVPSPQLAQNINPAVCAQAVGNIDLSISGSPTPYLFNWSNAATSEDLNNILSGNYTVTVTAGNGCTTVESFVVPENVLIPNIGNVLTPSTSCVTNNGAIDLSITPAVAQGYTFIWSNAAITEDLSNLAAGTYTVTVSAGGACTNTALLTVGSSLPLPAIAENIASAACAQSNGSIDLSITVGPTPYNFAWSTGATTEDLNTLLSGIYTVTVTAANGCTSFESFTVPENTLIPAVSGLAAAANSCLSFNGAVDLSVNFPSGYTVLWSNGSPLEDLSNLAPGNYTVTVNGGGACTNVASFTVTDQTTQPVATINANTTALDCSTTSTALNGSFTGTSNATSLQWLNNGAVLGTGNTLSVNAPGQYSLVVVDNVTFCSDTTSITITQSLNPPALSVAPPGVLTCSLPQQTLVGSSPISGVQLSWATINGTDTTLVGNGSTLQVLAAGTYVLLGINPANSCANSTAVIVTANQTPPNAIAGTGFTLDCAGETLPLNGSGTGGTNLSYQWTSADGHFVSGSNSPNPQIDQPGTYQLLVTNLANGCTDTDAVTITPEIPLAFASAIQPTCLDELGTVQIDSVTGLSEPILYSLNNGPLSAQTQYNNLPPGVYSIALEGGNGCTATAELTLEAPKLIEITLATVATVNLGYTYFLDPVLNIPNTDIASVLWTPSLGLVCDTCLSTFAKPDLSTQYQVSVVSKAGCEARGNIQLTVDRTRRVYGPNIFSPNDDGTNDIFTLFADPISVVKIKSLQIYSRWGEAVFEQQDLAPGDITVGWDGTFKGQKLNPAVFVWQAVVEFADGQEELFKGDVTLQR